MNATEQEAIILNSAWKMIDKMVNYSFFEFIDPSKQTNLLFQAREHQMLFIILLGDFLSQVRADRNESVDLGLRKVPNSQSARHSDLTFLFYLRQVCESPKLGADSSKLGKQVEAFADWLEVEFTAEDVYFNDIDLQTNLRITRYQYITMCGNIAKHDLVRLSRNVDKIKRLIKNENRNIDYQTAYLAVENFFDYFFENIFNYHSSEIAEFLNNIRWEIFHYLEPEYKRAYPLTGNVTSGFPAYNCRVPKTISRPIAVAMYRDLMNRVGQEPGVIRFVVPEILKCRYKP